MSLPENDSKGDTKTENAWRVKEPDEARYNFSDEKGVWQPKPEDILSLFEKLAQGKPLPLKWKCPGRRPPEKNVKSEKNTEDGMEFDGSDSKEDDSKAPETSAFDFDEPHIDVNTKLIPKRAPGGLGRTPKTEKRVARMDNIMKSLHKQQLQRAAEREARRSKGSPSGTPFNRSRLLNFGASPSGTPPNRSRLLNFGHKQSSPGAASSSAASPSRFFSSGATPSRFMTGSTALNSSPLLRDPAANTPPTTTPGKLPTKGSTAFQTGAAEPSIKTDVISMPLTSAQMIPVDATSEDSSEQTAVVVSQPESPGSADVPLMQSKSTTVSSANMNSLTNSVSKMSTSTNSLANGPPPNTAPSQANSVVDKDPSPTADKSPADSSLAFVSISSRAPSTVSTAVTPTRNTSPTAASRETQFITATTSAMASTSNTGTAVTGQHLDSIVADTIEVENLPSDIAGTAPSSISNVDLN